MIACSLIGTKPLFKSMLTYYQLDIQEQTSHWNFIQNNIFIEENVFENAVCGVAAILSQPQCVNKFVNPINIADLRFWWIAFQAISISSTQTETPGSWKVVEDHKPCWPTEAIQMASAKQRSSGVFIPFRWWSAYLWAPRSWTAAQQERNVNTRMQCQESTNWKKTGIP